MVETTVLNQQNKIYIYSVFTRLLNWNYIPTTEMLNEGNILEENRLPLVDL